ncbi:hypothetical protein GV64_15715 [Endozoicomonas elysicola]|uniref:AMP-dependent synthetase/ligase domain-containing protein n=1 Tax=Endozoicomonas elysicola TaxID=305900 RepID=A0A081KCV3_9GAMM|nr:hypothetical protein GV64_15715 [Endozoicomonas elysicola]
MLDRLDERARSIPQQTAIRSATPSANLRPDQAQWQEINWQQFKQKIDQTSLALLRHDLPAQTKIGIWSPNMPQWPVADLACQQARLVSVPLYPTDAAQQAEYILNETETPLLFVGEQTQYDNTVKSLSSLPGLKTIVVFDPSVDLKDCPLAIYFDEFIQQGSDAEQAVLDERRSTRSKDDLYTLIYTSGTTGDPKGVKLDYANMAASFRAHDQIINLSPEDVSLCFLPLSHIFERGWSSYVLRMGATNVYLNDPKQVSDALKAVKPTVMCTVPRLLEKAYDGIHKKVTTASPVKRMIFNKAMQAGAANMETLREGSNPTAFRKLVNRVADKAVFSKIRDKLGGQIRFMPCGGARLDPDINRFFHAIGINIKAGYGMTETCATVTCFPDKKFEFDTCGTSLPGIQIRIDDTVETETPGAGEIQVKGDTVMRGYYKKPEETAKAFTNDGWLHTGDAGLIEKSGALRMTGRIKELMKTSTGKYIAPGPIEGMLGKNQYIEQVAVIADDRSFVTALIVPTFEAIEEYARAHNLSYQDRRELVQHSKIQALLKKQLDTVQSGSDLASYQQVKKFTLLPAEFSIEQKELTPTLKLRRNVIAENYKQEIADMYKQEAKV